MGGDDLVHVDKRDHVTRISLARPQSLNAISGAMAAELTEAFDSVSQDSETWIVILRAEGEKAFCVGADLKERASFTLDDFYENRKTMRGMFAALRAIPQPVLAGVFGYTLGGGFELALSCDLIMGANGTEVGLPEASVGLLPAGGGTQLLTRRFGIARSKEMIFTGRRMGTEEALEHGLFVRVVPREHLDEAVLGLAAELCESSPVALRAAKRSIDAALGVPVEEGIDIEHSGWEAVIASEDRAEGIAAFNDKRKPRWKNH
jgi:enoyl-CoA hydratase/carnithine racemase